MDGVLTESIAESCRRRIAWLLFLRYTVILSIWWFFLWGTSVLVLRFACDMSRVMLALGGLGSVLVVLAAFIAASRKLPSRAAAVALIDGVNECGGLLMTDMDADVYNLWKQKMPAVAAPVISWKDTRMMMFFVAACVFLSGSFLVPNVSLAISSRGRLEIGDLIEELEEKTEILEEQEAIDEMTSKELKKKLEEIWKESAADDPVKSWEALDSIERKLEDKAAEAAAEDISEMEKLSKLAELSEELSEWMKNNENASEMAEVMKEFAALMKNQKIDPSLLKNIDEDLLKAMKELSLSSEQMKALAESMKSSCTNGCLNVASLCDSRMIDPKMLQMAKNELAQGKGALEEFLAENSDECMAIMACIGMSPGKGGITRGRGDAPMTWKDASTKDGAGFKEKTMTASALIDLKKTMLTGVSYGDPTEDTEKRAVSSDALLGAREGGGAAHKQVVYPKHKVAVERYFERGKDE